MECPCPNCRNKMIKKNKSDHLPSQLFHSSSWQPVNRIASLREVEVFLLGWAIILGATPFVFGKMSVAPISKLIVLFSNSFQISFTNVLESCFLGHYIPHFIDVFNFLLALNDIWFNFLKQKSVLFNQFLVLKLQSFDCHLKQRNHALFDPLQLSPKLILFRLNFSQLFDQLIVALLQKINLRVSSLTPTLSGDWAGWTLFYRLDVSTFLSLAVQCQLFVQHL